MTQSAAWVAVTLDAIADEDNTSAHDSLDLKAAAVFIREHEEEFNEVDVRTFESVETDEAAGVE